MNTNLDHSIQDRTEFSSDSHHGIPVLTTGLASPPNRRHTTSSDGTRAPDDDGVQEKTGAAQLALAGQDAPNVGPPFKKYGHQCKSQALQPFSTHAESTIVNPVFDPEIVSSLAEASINTLN